MRRVSIAERRARLGRRHHLAREAAARDVVQVAGDLCGLHATDPSSVFLSASARLAAREVEAIEHALYVDRSLVRMLGMRRTMFVVPRDLAAVVQASSTLALLPVERRTSLQLLTQAGVEGPEAWLADAEQATFAALGELGEATAVELSKFVPQLRQQVVGAPGTKWAATQGMSGRVLMLLAAEGRVVRGRPRGSWISSQYRWARMDAWLGAPLDELSVEEAQVELARRWLAAFGPGTAADLRWWTGWTVANVRRALAKLDPVEVDLEHGTGLVLPGDLEPVPGTEPWVALLPSLDPTAMGWTERGWYLGEHREHLFDRSGNIGPTIWCDGRIVGGWAQRKDGDVAVRLLEDVGGEAAAAVELEAGRVAEWLGPLRVTPRFRTPLARELTA
ncbi:MAG: winged helix DNA-binding domain-containing protein [Acidimicrobiia bacterium]|nr:winged helix DNA-binding domain-containing protein [Acidimicrobiia bacterium]